MANHFWKVSYRNKHVLAFTISKNWKQKQSWGTKTVERLYSLYLICYCTLFLGRGETGRRDLGLGLLWWLSFYGNNISLKILWEIKSHFSFYSGAANHEHLQTWWKFNRERGQKTEKEREKPREEKKGKIIERTSRSCCPCLCCVVVAVVIVIFCGKEGCAVSCGRQRKLLFIFRSVRPDLDILF